MQLLRTSICHHEGRYTDLIVIKNINVQEEEENLTDQMYYLTHKTTDSQLTNNLKKSLR